MLLPYLSHIPHVWNVWQTVSECRRGKKFHLKIELNDTSKSNLRWYMQNQFAFCILFIQWNGKKVREVVKTCHIQTFQKKSTSGEWNMYMSAKVSNWFRKKCEVQSFSFQVWLLEFPSIFTYHVQKETKFKIW